MATNYECVISVLATHREARRWADEAVAIDLLAQLGLDAAGEVGAVPMPAVAGEIETKHYTDGSSATGPAPLPDLSPEQQAAQQGAMQQAANDGAALQV